jgi:hypothetical protein
MNTIAAVTPKPFPVPAPKPISSSTIPRLKLEKSDYTETDNHLMLMMAALLSSEREHDENLLEQTFQKALQIRRFVASKRSALIGDFEKRQDSVEASFHIKRQLVEFAIEREILDEKGKHSDVDLGTVFRFAISRTGLPCEKATTNIIANLAIDFMRAKEGEKLREQVQKELTFWSNIPNKPEALKRALKSRGKLLEFEKRSIRLVLEFQKLAPNGPGIFGVGTEPDKVMSQAEKIALLRLPISLRLMGNDGVLLQLIDWVNGPAMLTRIRKAIGGFIKGGKNKDPGSLTSVEKNNLNAAANEAKRKTGKKVKFLLTGSEALERQKTL